jgi:HSP20 family protein
VDIYETEAGVVFLVDVPGVSKEDVEVELAGGVLSIRGQKRPRGPCAGRKYYQAECAYGSFERSFAIRLPVEWKKAKASFVNGVLRITLPKRGQVSCTIPVKST